MTAPQLTSYANQGSAGVNADQLNTFGQTCDNLAQLRTLVGLPGMQVTVRGTLVPDDGGQGVFYWDPNGLGPDNATTIIVPDAALTGAWIRLAYLNFQSVFMPKLSAAPAAAAGAGILYVSSAGTLRYRGPTTDTLVAPA